MAIRQRPAQINRTPAPKLDRQHGGQDYGEANAVGIGASMPPGVGGPQTILGQNLRESVVDPVADQILKLGVAGRPDHVPTDTVDDVDPQLRPVSAESYPLAHGAVRQQADYNSIGKPTTK